MNEDMRQLRSKVENMGLFKANPLFFLAHLAHIILLEILAYTIMAYFGFNWTTFIVVATVMATSQVKWHACVYKKKMYNFFYFFLNIFSFLNK